MKNKDNKTDKASSGIGFLGALTIAFIVLKLCGVISWGWLWVLAPLWAPIAALGLAAFVTSALVEIIDHFHG